MTLFSAISVKEPGESHGNGSVSAGIRLCEVKQMNINQILPIRASTEQNPKLIGCALHQWVFVSTAANLVPQQRQQPSGHHSCGSLVLAYTA